MTSDRKNIHFDKEDLEVLAKAHQKVVLIKHTEGQTDTPVTWVSFKPWQQNTIDWENTFAIYASNSEVQSKATIYKMSDTHATCGVQYDFSDGTFAPPKLPETSVVPNTYYAKNLADDYPAITLGLPQDAKPVH